MQKIKIKLVTIGAVPAKIDRKKLLNWKSSVLCIDKSIDDYPLQGDSDLDDWSFSDQSMRSHIPEYEDHDFVIAITNVPLQLNWYSRRLDNKNVLFTFHEIKEYLDKANIPLENAILRVLYAYSIAYKSNNNAIPNYDGQFSFTHDETKGCLFDMNGLKMDLIESCHSPIICTDCEHKFSRNNVPGNVIHSIQKEIKKIKKPLYYRWVGFIKHHPIISLFLSIFSVIVLGMISSILATLTYEHLIK